MKNKILKNAIKTGLIFLATYFGYFFYETYLTVKSFYSNPRGYNYQLSLNDFIPDSNFIIEIIFFLIIAITFYFLFKYQQEKYSQKKIVLKFTSNGFFLGIILAILLNIFIFIECTRIDGMDGMGCALAPMFLTPLLVLGFPILFSVLILNSKYKTNLFLVVWILLIFSYINLGMAVLGFEISMGLADWGGFFSGISLIIGTIIAIIVKKIKVSAKNELN